MVPGRRFCVTRSYFSWPFTCVPQNFAQLLRLQRPRLWISMLETPQFSRVWHLPNVTHKKAKYESQAHFAKAQYWLKDKYTTYMSYTQNPKLIFSRSLVGVKFIPCLIFIYQCFHCATFMGLMWRLKLVYRCTSLLLSGLVKKLTSLGANWWFWS